MKLAFVTTLSIEPTYWKDRSGFEDMYGCVLRSHILNVKKLYTDSDFHILVNDKDQSDAILTDVAEQTNSTIRVSHWDKTWLRLRSSKVIECCSTSWEPDFFAPQMLKIEAFNIFGYDYVVYSDMDLFLTRKAEFHNLHIRNGMMGAGGDDIKRLHGGLFIIKPDSRSFRRVQNTLYSGFSVKHGWNALPCEAEHGNWTWFAAGADEGLLYASFACLNKFKRITYDEFVQFASHTHFYGKGKPWEIQGSPKTYKIWCNSFYSRPDTTHELKCDTNMCTRKSVLSTKTH